MSKILLTVDTETKTILLKVDGQEVPDVSSFSLGLFDTEKYNPETDSYDKIEDVLSVNFSVCKEVDGKNTKTDIYYNLSNSEELDDAEGSYPGFKIKSEIVEKSIIIQDAIAKLFKS
jgi:hypothetical protein